MSQPSTPNFETSSGQRLLPGLAAHLDRLAGSFDRIDEGHRKAGERLAAWIAENHARERPLHITVVCTGNSRRSILGATMGNFAAAYCGLPEIRFHSGGTAPTAFYHGTVACLKEIGIEIEPTGEEAPRGEPGTANPIYRVRWGSAGEPPMETLEFSKRYDDPSNPQQDFAALMVCDEADAGCPAVRGAALRISLPFPDPKTFDQTPEEATRYAERRDDLGRLMLWVMMRTREHRARR